MEYVKNIGTQDDVVVLTVENVSMHLQEILSRVEAAERIEVRSASLNDVFLHFTGRELRDEAGEGGIFQRIMRTEARR